MDEKEFEGKTRAEWLVFENKVGGSRLGCPSDTDIQRAILWFESEDKKPQIERDERRFQAQLDETKRQGSLTRLIAWLALVVSAASVIVAICALVSRSAPPQQHSAPTPQQMPPSVSQTTNALPATTPKP
jgi:hypothetical protein